MKKNEEDKDMIKIELKEEKLGKKTVMTREIADARFVRYDKESWRLFPSGRNAGILFRVLNEDGTEEWVIDSPLPYGGRLSFDYVEELDWFMS